MSFWIDASHWKRRSSCRCSALALDRIRDTPGLEAAACDEPMTGMRLAIRANKIAPNGEESEWRSMIASAPRLNL